jgi:hypothetical protein
VQEIDKALELAIQQIIGVHGEIAWDTGKKVRARAKEAPNGPFAFECDVYLHLKSEKGDGEVSLKSILADVSDELRLLNSDNG